MCEKLRIESRVLGMVATNCYFLINEETKQVILVDPSDNADEIIEKINQKNLKLSGILLTHGHFDHIMAVNELCKNFQTKVYAMEEEKEMLENPATNLSTQVGRPMSLTPDVLLQDGESIHLAGFSIKAIHTPGHTKGGVCYYFQNEEILLSGDTLFLESIGRTDLPTGSASQLIRSIKSRLMSLDDQVKVYPGHGDATTIGHERQYNPYIV